MAQESRGFFEALVDDGRPLISLTALCLALSGAFALFQSMTGHFLPHDTEFLQMAPQDLCGINECRIVHFMFHDRVSFGGALIAISALYLWLAEFPLKAGEAWSWWALLVSGVIGFGSFLTYLERFYAKPSAIYTNSVIWGHRRWPMPYSKEFRGEVLAACDANEGTRAIAVRFAVSESWVRRIKQQRRETGQVAPKLTRQRRPKWHDWADWLLSKIAERPDIYLRELQAELKAERGESASLQTICKACREIERTRKKRPS